MTSTPHLDLSIDPSSDSSLKVFNISIITDAIFKLLTVKTKSQQQLYLGIGSESTAHQKQFYSSSISGRLSQGAWPCETRLGEKSDQDQGDFQCLARFSKKSIADFCFDSNVFLIENFEKMSREVNCRCLLTGWRTSWLGGGGRKLGRTLFLWGDPKTLHWSSPHYFALILWIFTRVKSHKDKDADCWCIQWNVNCYDHRVYAWLQSKNAICELVTWFDRVYGDKTEQYIDRGAEVKTFLNCDKGPHSDLLDP